MLTAFVRRWLQLDGPGGLADVLTVKDQTIAGLRADVDRHAFALRDVIHQLNANTHRLAYYDALLPAVPSVARVKRAFDARKLREQQQRNAPPAVTGTEPRDQGEGAEAAEEMLPQPVADDLAEDAREDALNG